MSGTYCTDGSLCMIGCSENARKCEQFERPQAELREALGQRTQTLAEVIKAAKELIMLLDVANKPESVNIVRQLIALLPKEDNIDVKRIDWLELQANQGRFELARSLYRGGYEFGYWPKSGPVVEVHSGNLRGCIDKAMLGDIKK